MKIKVAKDEEARVRTSTYGARARSRKLRAPGRTAAKRPDLQTRAPSWSGRVPPAEPIGREEGGRPGGGGGGIFLGCSTKASSNYLGGKMPKIVKLNK
jgi:hypothetical protein